MNLRSNRIVDSLSKIKISLGLKVLLSAVLLALITTAPHSQADSVKNASVNLKLDINSGRVFATSVVKPQIVVGESMVDATARVERERVAQEQAKLVASRNVVAREYRAVSFPQNVDLTALYKSAAAKFGIADWRILKAIHYVETGCDTTGQKVNPSGATGPMQFLPSTWRFAGQDGDGDGVKDIRNVSDAVHGAANYLAMSGGQLNIRTGLYSYNRSISYVNKVIAVAESISQ